MSLLLGNLGREILDHCVNNPQSRLNRARTASGKLVRAISPNYCLGLSRETFKLWQYAKLHDVQNVEIRADGFFENEQKIAGDEIVGQAFLQAGIQHLDMTQVVGPEELA